VVTPPKCKLCKTSSFSRCSQCSSRTSSPRALRNFLTHPQASTPRCFKDKICRTWPHKATLVRNQQRELSLETTPSPARCRERYPKLTISKSGKVTPKMSINFNNKFNRFKHKIKTSMHPKLDTILISVKMIRRILSIFNRWPHNSKPKEIALAFHYTFTSPHLTSPVVISTTRTTKVALLPASHLEVRIETKILPRISHVILILSNLSTKQSNWSKNQQPSLSNLRSTLTRLRTLPVALAKAHLLRAICLLP
jgi:hypothetical protein